MLVDNVNPIPPWLFLELITPGGGSIWPPFDLKSTNAIAMKHWPEVDNYKKFQFYLLLEKLILLFVFYEVIKFKTMENITILNKILF